MKYAGLYVVCLVLVIGNIFVWWDLLSSQTQKVLAPSANNETVAVREEVDQPIVETTGSGPTIFVPILMYHYIRDYTNQDDQLGIGLSVAPSVFSQQLQDLKKAGYRSISLNDFAAKKYDSKSVVITFDDGYEDHYINALPILKELGMTGTFFIVRNFVGTPGYMSRSQIDELRQSGMEIGGHSVGHKNLANLEYEAAVRDISTSLLGTDNIFCYPSGKYSPTTLDIVSGLGVMASVTTNYGIATDKSAVQELPRIRVKQATNILKRISEETLIAKSEKTTSQRTSD